eukprot:15464870-Alexandrium_andersonii.AAC.1
MINLASECTLATPAHPCPCVLVDLALDSGTRRSPPSTITQLPGSVAAHATTMKTHSHIDSHMHSH